ncbi:MAG TPA: GNAT family protein [Mycobacteriales bacterium]|nr:GNAT family protein [Mycobacteriales bacterium]
MTARSTRSTPTTARPASGSHWTACRGEGLGTEATGLVLDFAFGELGLYRVELEVFDYNVRAQKSYVKSGFTVEGVKRGGLLWDGHRHDVICMAALNPAGNAQVAGTVEGSVRRSGTLVTTSAPVHATHDRRPGGHHTRGPRS